MRHRHALLCTLAAVAASLKSGQTTGHNNDTHEKAGPFHYGVAGKLGDATVRPYVILAKEKDKSRNRRRPVALGIEIPESAMETLPAETVVLILDFPIQARDTRFQYVMLDWNPNGHDPVGVYDKPHFDFHFYIQDVNEVLAIDPGPCSNIACDDYELAMKPVRAEFLPEGYINVGSVIPFMGNHLIHPASPEYNGQPFTRTWLYGAFDGNITFYEPMITRQALMSEPSYCEALKLPQAFAEAGYYPTAYCTERDTDAKVYRVFMKDFIYRDGTQQPAGEHSH